MPTWHLVWVVCWLVFVAALVGYFLLAAYLYVRDVHRERR